MPHKDPAVLLAYKRKYREKNRAAVREYHRAYEARRKQEGTWLPKKYYTPWSSLTEKQVRQRREENYKAKYGITLSEAEGLLSAQGGACAVCGSCITFGGRGGAHLDHCHATGKIRGVLCHACNVSLGHSRESVSRLRKCADYLEIHKCSN